MYSKDTLTKSIFTLKTPESLACFLTLRTFTDKIRLPPLSVYHLTLRRLNANTMFNKADNSAIVLKESIISKEITRSFKNKDKRLKTLRIYT